MIIFQKWKQLAFFTLLLLVGQNITSLSQKSTFDAFHYRATLQETSLNYPNKPDYVITVFKKLRLKAQQESNYKKEVYILIYIGREYMYKKRDVGIAEQYFLDALALSTKHDFCTGEIFSKIHLNAITFSLNKLDEFIKNYEEISAQLKICPEPHHELYTYTQLAINYANLGKDKQSLGYCLKIDSLIHHEKYILEELFFSYSTVIHLYAKYAPEKVNKTVNEAKLLYLNKSNFHTLPYIYSSLTGIYKATNQLDSAIYYTKQIIKLPAHQYAPVEQEVIFGANNVLSDLYEQKKDYIAALYYQKRFSAIKDSLMVVDKAQSSKNNLEFVTQQKELIKKQEELRFNRFVLFFISLIVATALVFLYIIYKKNSRISKLYKRLTEQKTELQHLNSLRTKMLSILSHDLTSPIGALINNIEMYEKGLFTKNDFELNQSRLKGNLSSILSTIRSVVSWSYIMQNSDKIEKEQLSPYEIIEELFRLQTIHAQLYRHDLVNSIQSDVRINANKNHFTLIARNLIDNAIKHTPPNGRIEVNCDCSENSIILYFKDNGKGIKKDILENILTKKRITSTTLIPHLGLQMVFDIVSLNHYSIDIKSENNQGTIISIKIPIEKSVVK